jgi:hypothetical protein
MVTKTGARAPAGAQRERAAGVAVKNGALAAPTSANASSAAG